MFWKGNLVTWLPTFKHFNKSRHSQKKQHNSLDPFHPYSFTLQVLIHHHLGEGHGTPLQCSCLENPVDGGAWWAAVHGVAKSQTRLSDFTFTFHVHALEKEMAAHSGVLAWRIPGTGEPGGLPSMGPHRAGHDWRDLAAAAADTTTYTPPQTEWFFLQCLKQPMPPLTGNITHVASAWFSLSWPLSFTSEHTWKT